MACGTRKDSESLPTEESLDKPFPFPLQERGDQRWLASQSQQRRERVLEDPPRENEVDPGLLDPPSWLDLARLFAAKIQRIRNVSIAKFVTYLLAVAMEILKIFSIQKDKTRERNEMKTKMEEITNTKLKEVEHHKWKLEEQIKNGCTNLFRIRLIESMEWEMNLITMKELVFRFGAEIACLQSCVGRLESGALTAINWIVVQLTTGVVVIGVLCYWVYVKGDSQTGTTVNTVITGCILGVATHCIRKAQAVFDGYALVSECEQVKNKLENSKKAYVTYKHAVDDILPGKRKMLRVVDHDLSQMSKCKND